MVDTRKMGRVSDYQHDVPVLSPAEGHGAAGHKAVGPGEVSLGAAGHEVVGYRVVGLG